MKLTLVQIDRHGVGRVGLDFQGVRASLGRGFDDSERPLQGLVMVSGHLRDDKWGLIAADYPPGDR